MLFSPHCLYAILPSLTLCLPFRFIAFHYCYTFFSPHPHSPHSSTQPHHLPVNPLKPLSLPVWDFSRKLFINICKFITVWGVFISTSLSLDTWLRFSDTWPQFSDTLLQFSDTWLWFSDTWPRFSDTWLQFSDTWPQFKWCIISVQWYMTSVHWPLTSFQWPMT